MELKPELDEAWSALFERFLQSEECAVAACGPSRWLFSFLDCMRSAEWSLDELDLDTLTAALYDGMGWTIDATPEDPAAVARELHAFLCWAVRSGVVQRSPAYEECCTYLASPEAVAGIRQWLTPSTICWHDGSSDDCHELDRELDRDPPLAN